MSSFPSFLHQVSFQREMLKPKVDVSSHIYKLMKVSNIEELKAGLLEIKSKKLDIKKIIFTTKPTVMMIKLINTHNKSNTPTKIEELLFKELEDDTVLSFITKPITTIGLPAEVSRRIFKAISKSVTTLRFGIWDHEYEFNSKGYRCFEVNPELFADTGPHIRSVELPIQTSDKVFECLKNNEYITKLVIDASDGIRLSKRDLDLIKSGAVDSTYEKRIAGIARGRLVKIINLILGSKKIKTIEVHGLKLTLDQDQVKIKTIASDKPQMLNFSQQEVQDYLKLNQNRKYTIAKGMDIYEFARNMRKLQEFKVDLAEIIFLEQPTPAIIKIVNNYCKNMRMNAPKLIFKEINDPKILELIKPPIWNVELPKDVSETYIRNMWYHSKDKTISDSQNNVELAKDVSKADIRYMWHHFKDKIISHRRNNVELPKDVSEVDIRYMWHRFKDRIISHRRNEIEVCEQVKDLKLKKNE